MKIRRVASLALLGAGCVIHAAQAEVYKSVDEKGNVTYSNIPSKDARKLDLPPLTVVPAVRPELEPQRPDAAAAAEIEARRAEIEKKITDETELLEATKREYNNGEPERIGGEKNYQRYLDRVQRLRDEITLHEANLGLLRLELQKLGGPGRE